MSKALTEILDLYGYDTDQEKIQNCCIQKVQPQKTRVYVDIFNKLPINIDIWRKGEDPATSAHYKIDVNILAQPESGIDLPTWSGPKMSEAQLDQHHTRLVAIWRTGQGNAHDYHAVYVKKIEKDNSGLYWFYCINSWGNKNDPNPKIENKDIVGLYYISLYRDPD